jgi:hypothetical protein
LAAFVALAGFYVGLVVYIDNTNLGTTNGLWKTPLVRNWETNTGHPVESGAPLYLPVYGLLSRAIPDRVVSYGAHGSVLTFRKMAILNALFGALASCAVFLLAVRLLKSQAAALTVCLGHALAAFVLLNSLNSEDVIPAYAFFVIASALLLEYMATRKWFWLPASVLFFVLAMLFHWTLIVPALAAAGAVLLALALLERRQRWAPAAFFALFFVAVLLASGLPSLVLGRTIPVLVLLYPGQAHPNGYLGLSTEKVLLAVMGVGNYFSGGRNLTNYDAAFGNREELWEMAVSWLYLMLAIGGCVWSWFSRFGSRNARLLALFGLVLFGVGELEHLYSQPQDPQSQIQPMLVGTIGLIVILSIVERLTARKVLLSVLGGLTVAFICNGAHNLGLMSAARGQDSSSLETVKQLGELFPPEGTVLVLEGSEAWDTWRFAETFHGNSEFFGSRMIYLATPFTQRAGVSAADAAEWARGRIDRALDAGDSVVTRASWIEQRREFVGSLIYATSRENAGAYWDILHSAYETGRSWNTRVGRFVELHRPATDSPLLRTPARAGTDGAERPFDTTRQYSTLFAVFESVAGAPKSGGTCCISGLLTPTAGHVRVNGHDVVRDGKAARSSIGVVPQELALYDDLTAAENLDYWGGAQGGASRRGSESGHLRTLYHALHGRSRDALRPARHYGPRQVDRAGDARRSSPRCPWRGPTSGIPPSPSPASRVSSSSSPGRNCGSKHAAHPSLCSQGPAPVAARLYWTGYLDRRCSSSPTVSPTPCCATSPSSWSWLPIRPKPFCPA